MFALVDCNNFYASCERVFRPDLKGKPIVVLSNNDGCVIARSAEAKVLGYEMGDPYHLAREKLQREGVAVFSSNYTLYGDLSARVLHTLTPFAEEIENYSIDESFLRFSPGPEWQPLAEKIRATVRKHTGVPVSVGVAPTKVLSKLANKISKRRPELRGVFVMPAGDEKDELLKTFATGDLWGIGRQLSARLAANNVHTAFDLMQLEPEVAKTVLTIVGQRIVYELRGISCLAIEDVIPAKKNIISSRSFGRAITDKAEMLEAVAAYASRAAEKLRKDDSVCAHVRTFIETNPFVPNAPQYFNSAGYTLDTATNSTPELARAACNALEVIWRTGYRYKKCGVMLLDLHASAEIQSAFSTPEPEKLAKARRAMAALDAVNKTFGRGAVQIATAGIAPPWSMKRGMCSPRYTTRWTELPIVSC
ncbi:Y-family DNA polymerase [Oleiharenicola lentus]|uniref:Y-family DNA polymerase n=1 Tax=Oleiharenicola lentus TaxID=2508720 RepID=UPI003F66C526